MKAGVSQIDITPQGEVELSGFGNRVQPSAGVLDSLYARCLYLQDGRRRLLWAHADLIGFDRGYVKAFRLWAKRQLGLEETQVLVSGTHTHSGPVTVRFGNWWKYDEAYLDFLTPRLREAAESAVARAEDCDVVAAEGHCELGRDRRGKASAHTDPRIVALGWRRPDGTFLAAVVNYTMHAVALGGQNRMISADVPGQAAATVSGQLPGNPTVLITNGACGNIDPPEVGVSFEKVQEWGRQLGLSIAGALANAQPVPAPTLLSASCTVPLPLEVFDEDQINQYAEKYLSGASNGYRRAIEFWRRTMTEKVGDPAAAVAEAELFALRIGGVLMVGVNAEIFSRFTEQVRRLTGKDVCTVGYANGVIGYIPTAAAYAEGGYEVENAMFIYNVFRPRSGGLEMLAERASDLISRMLAGA